MKKDCIFCKIINREIEAEIVMEDDHVIAFRDINPQAPVHILIVTKEHISTVNDIDDKHAKIIIRMMTTASKIAKQFGIDKSGYRLVTNCNKDSGQVVFHLHTHLLGGKKLGGIC